MPREVRHLVGVSVWLVLALIAAVQAQQHALIRALLAWAALVIAPVAVRAIDDGGPTMRIVRRLQPAFAAALGVSLLLPAGALAVALAMPWATLCLTIGASGGVRAMRRSTRTASGMIEAIGMMLLPVGGGWAVIAAAGARPMGFVEPIVTLTAVHFHYSGFALPLVAGAVICAARPPAWLAWSIVAGIVLGVPGVAIGIVMSPAIEIVAAGLLFGAVVMCAGLLAWAGMGRRVHRTAASMWGFASLAAVVAITPAAGYAVGEWLGRPLIDIPTVAATHGVLMAMGFSTFGLLGAALHKEHGHGFGDDGRCGCGGAAEG